MLYAIPRKSAINESGNSQFPLMMDCSDGVRRLVE